MMSDGDFLFSDKFEMGNFNGYDPNSEVIPLILNEFQPETFVYYSALVGDLVGSVASGALDLNKFLTRKCIF